MPIHLEALLTSTSYVLTVPIFLIKLYSTLFLYAGYGEFQQLIQALDLLVFNSNNIRSSLSSPQYYTVGAVSHLSC